MLKYTQDVVLMNPRLPNNIVIFECQDVDGRVSGETIFMTLVRGTWFFFDPRPDVSNVWHKPGRAGIAFIEQVIASGNACRVSEDRFQRMTDRSFLDSAADILGLMRQQPMNHV